MPAPCPSYPQQISAKDETQVNNQRHKQVIDGDTGGKISYTKVHTNQENTGQTEAEIRGQQKEEEEMHVGVVRNL
jgi:hypothetical protein